MPAKKKPKKNSTYFWKNCPSPNSRSRNQKCPECGRPHQRRQECVYCATVKWMQAQGLPLPVSGVDGDSHGRATRQLNRMVGVSN
jgi:ribosomal protein S27AE